MKKLLKSLFINSLGSFCTPANGVHIINSHYLSKDTSKVENARALEKKLKHLLNYGDIISLPKAVQLINDQGQNGNNDKYFSLTFDDGFEECYTLISPVFDRLDLKATFFINANYIDSNQEYQNEFNRRIHNSKKRPMSWDQVTKLNDAGFLIGSHTLDHFDLSMLNTDELEYQIARNNEIIKNKLATEVDYFAWPYGNFNSFPDAAFEISKKYHKYIFSGTNYKYYFSKQGKIINRRHLEPFWPISYFNYFLSSKKK
ncbi:polysaccharide deacetylase family protein [Arthrospiribacter ruber]|uniref:Polysaccharide deacetylase family protein n=1 Tax=Arthrospiribacter ruber TaxID=2487934 RepID=A0A951IR03_9BACT|nr:polysaccharide deacetylase family protein [Arthrospiribacter ruber]MBW3466410.1 polysaccharide deacetylase family protein [Arthrospiribacter ruber]